MKRLLTGTALGVFFLAPAALAQQDAVSDFLSCDPLVIPSERLACFDSILKQYKLKYGLLDGSAQNLAQESLSRPRAVPQGRVNAESLGGVYAPGNVKANPDQIPEEFEATIIRTWKVGVTDYVELDNGTVWKESGGKNLRSAGNEQVRVSKGLFGGSRMMIGPSRRIVSVKRVR